MKTARDDALTDRRAASKDAKISLPNAYRTAQTGAEQSKLARQAERTAIALAREERRVQRERLKHEERTRVETHAEEQRAVAEAEALAEAKAREGAENALIARVIEDETARKAKRDWRYASLKARQG